MYYIKAPKSQIPTCASFQLLNLELYRYLSPIKIQKFQTHNFNRHIYKVRLYEVFDYDKTSEFCLITYYIIDIL